MNFLLRKNSSTAQNHSDERKVRQVLHDLFSANQKNGSEITFVTGATKINLKNLKTQLWLDDLMQATI